MTRRGFTLIETLFIVALLGFFILASSQLFVATTRIFHGASAAQEDAVRYDALSRRLARDAWGAARIETPDAATAVLTQPDGTLITWTLPGDGGSIVRTAARPGGDAEETVAAAIHEPFGFAAEGDALVIRPLKVGTLMVTERRYPSQVLQAKGGRP